jgi:RNA polymerase sigma-70 factor, ECF subfamily
MAANESPNLDQQDLVEAARGGDKDAFDGLVRQTYVDTYTLAVRLTGNEEDASDVVQEAYIRAWKGIRRFRGDARFSTWMYRITANAAYTHLGRRRRTRTESLDDVAEPIEERIGARPDVAAESAAMMGRLSEAVAELPPKLRAIVVLKDVYGLPHEAIAEELGISVTAAKVRLHRGRKRLREMLFDEHGRSAHAV